MKPSIEQRNQIWDEFVAWKDMEALTYKRENEQMLEYIARKLGLERESVRSILFIMILDGQHPTWKNQYA